MSVGAATSGAALYDVSVLLALSWPRHEFHAQVRHWVTAHRGRGWATCTITEAGFVRVSSQPSTGLAQGLAQALLMLEKNCAQPDHVFWPMTVSITQILPEIRERIAGHQQLTDALLLDLAIRNGGRLVTLDQRVTHLLPANSPHRAALEVISA